MNDILYFQSIKGTLSLVKSLSNLQNSAKKIVYNFNNSNFSGSLYKSTKFSWDSKKKILVINEVEPDNNFLDAIEVKFDISKSVNFGNNGTILSSIKMEYPCPSIESGFYFDEKQWNILVRNILKKKNTLLIGPTGTGKTDIIIKICEKMNIPCRIYDMGAMMDPLTDLLGQHKLKDGNSIFEYSRFVEDIQKPGVILLDELSRAPFGSNNILFPCLDCRRKLPVDIASVNDNREINVHHDCVFIATANIGNEYTGTSELDAALLNRFITIQVDYLNNDAEKTILINKYNISEEQSNIIVKFASSIRSSYLSGKLSKPVSTRETLSCAEMISDGFSIIDSIDYSMCQKFQKFGDNPEYNMVKEILMGY